MNTIYIILGLVIMHLIFSQVYLRIVIRRRQEMYIQDIIGRNGKIKFFALKEGSFTGNAIFAYTPEEAKKIARKRGYTFDDVCWKVAEIN